MLCVRKSITSSQNWLPGGSGLYLRPIQLPGAFGTITVCMRDEGQPGRSLAGCLHAGGSATLGELLMEMDDERVVSGQVPRGMYSTPLTVELIEATVRLLECLRSPADSRILGPQAIREIIYRVLCGEQGGALRAVAARHSHFSQIARVLRRMYTEYQHELNIDALAREAGMRCRAFITISRRSPPPHRCST